MKKFLQIGVAADAVKHFHESLKFTLVRNQMLRPWSARRQNTCSLRPSQALIYIRFRINLQIYHGMNICWCLRTTNFMLAPMIKIRPAS